MVLAHQAIALATQLDPRERALGVQPQPRRVLHELRATVPLSRLLRGRGGNLPFALRSAAGGSPRRGARHSLTGSM
jgi:hypothetical protein